MAFTISVLEADLRQACSLWLAQLVTGQVIAGQDNRVALPTGDFVVIQTLYSRSLSTNRPAWTAGTANPGQEANERSMEWVAQLDVYGDTAADSAGIISELARTEYSVDLFGTFGIDVVPLYATDPRQTSMIDGEQQYQQRYTLELHAQYNPVVTTPLDFANALTIVPASVDAVYPPGEIQ